MLHNASNKITIWAKVVLFAGIALSIIAGFFIIWFGIQNPTLRFTDYHTGALYRVSTTASTNGLPIIAGFLVMIFGSLASWLIALLLQAFGDLTADTRAIRKELEGAFYETESVESAYTKAAEPIVEAKVEEVPAEPAKPEEPESK